MASSLDIDRAALTRGARIAIMRVLIGVFRRIREPLVREPLFKVIRRADDAGDSFTRALLRDEYDIQVGRQTYGAFAIDGRVAPGTHIGAFCSVAPGARLGGSQHPTDNVSTHPFLYLANRGFVSADDPVVSARMNPRVVIEDDVWLGAHCVVMPGVKVGRGAVVGAGAVVTKDVEPYAVALGVPARVERKRLTDSQARELAGIDWPGWDDDTIRRRLADFYDVDAFVKRYGPQR